MRKTFPALTALLLGGLNLGLASAARSDTPAQVMELQPKTFAFVRKIDERFQSFQIGMSHLTGGETWKSYDPAQKGEKQRQAANFDAVRETRQPADLDSARLRSLTAPLGPFYIRYGGTTANSVYFQNDDNPALAEAPHGYSVVLTRAGWKRGIDFARAVNAEIVTGFAVSDGVRDKNGGWTSRSAAPWIDYTRSANGHIYAAELFNEPNAPEPGRMPKGQAPKDFARDFAIFRSFMAMASPKTQIAGPGVAMMGVDVPSLRGFTPEDYAGATPQPKFDILSYHFYGALAERCAPATSPMGISAQNALSEEWLARPDATFARHKMLRDRYAPDAPIWITETGAAACGGPRWQTSFLDTFRFLDTQARLAKQGVDAMFHHALISGSNGILDEKTFLPNADYWAALLWRRLMGTAVLDAGPAIPGVHLYAHCMRAAPGGVTLLAINLGSAPATIKGLGQAGVYALTAPELQSGTLFLNNSPLTLGTDDSLPKIAAEPLKGGSFSLAPTSIAFITLPAAGNKACR